MKKKNRYLGLTGLPENIRASYINLMRTIKSNLAREDKELVLVLGAFRQGLRHLFDYQDFLDLSNTVDYFSLMTYDFSSPNQ